jgi:YVTN family beta-propeller protein
VPADPRIGSVAAGYRIDALIGRGGMGVVYRAEHIHLERTVAFKLLAPEIADQEGFRERFMRESRLAASLQHANIVTVYDAGEVDGLLFISMQYVPGENLAGLLAREGPLEPRRALDIFGEVGSALDAAHRSGLVHRDVKPGNVLIGADRAYLTDFGLTRRTDSQSAVTATGQMLGTIDYCAPEQIQAREVDGRTDVYALGCMLYECLSGERPFRRDTEIATLYAHLESAPPRLSQQRPDLPPALDDVIEGALAKSKEDRWSTCGELVGAARAALGAQKAPLASEAPTKPASTPAAGDIAAPANRPAPKPATTAGPAAALPEPAPARRRLPVALLAFAGLALVGIIVALIALGGGEESEPGGGGGGTDARSFRVGERPFGIRAGGGDVFVVAQSSGELRRLQTDGSGGVSIPVGAEPFWVAEGEEAIWVSNRGDDTVSRLTRDDLSEVGPPVPVGAAPYWVAAEDGVAWVSNGDDDTVTRIDEGTGTRIGEDIPVGRNPRGVGITAGSVWVTSNTDNSVTRIDSGTGQVQGEPIPVGDHPVGIAAGAGMVWIANEGDNSVTHIDAGTGEVVGDPVPVGSEPFDVAIGEGSVWVTNSADDTVTRIDPDSGRPAGDPIEVKGQPTGIAVGGGYVWVVSNDSGRVTRLEP